MPKNASRAYLVPLLTYSASVTLKHGLTYGFNVIENDTIRKLRYLHSIAITALSCIVSEIKRSKIAILVNVMFALCCRNFHENRVRVIGNGVVR